MDNNNFVKPIKVRNTGIDWLKVFAVFLVMNSHMLICYPKYGFLASGGAIGDALFFFASGFTLFLGRTMRFDNWYKRRINRIYSSIFATAIITWAIWKNAVPMKAVSNVIDLGKTVAFDLASPEVIWDNIISKNRNMIRKAEKNGIEIRHGKGLDLFADFKRIYNATMDKDNAEEYYYFGDAFYESIHNDLHDNYEMFYAVLNGEIIAMSIMLYGNKQMHYHLSGSMIEYRNLAPSNLLLYQAALWGCEHGFKTFHLGGGVGSGEDNLYKFKAAFNKMSDYQFSIGKQIFDQEKYDELVKIRRESDSSFEEKSDYFPLYRS